MRFEQDELDDIRLYHSWHAIAQFADGALYYRASEDGTWSRVTWTHVIEALQL